MIRVIPPDKPKDLDGYSVVPKGADRLGRVKVKRIQWDSDYTWEEVIEVYEELIRSE